MADPLLSRPGTSANPAPIGLSLPGTASSSASSPASSLGAKPFGAKSLQRKRPIGLSIDKAIESSRAPPGVPLNGDGRAGLSEAEQLRQDIAKLQLSSRSSDSDSQSPATSPTQPLTPNTLNQSDSSSSGVKKKSKDKEGKKKHKVDKDGQDLVKDEDLEILTDLGAGNGGTVTKVWNKKRKCIMARKLILVDAKPSVRKQIMRELQIMNDCNSQYIVGYYGCFPADVHVGVVMECMDAGSLNDIYRRNGAIPVQIVGKVAEAVLRGLIYLYDVHRIIHRDIKPSNILANTAGQIKICDFGVSGELINSIANTFVERIQGAAYTIKSDVWSLGISLIEIATGRFPFQDGNDSASDTDSDDDDEGEYDPDPTLPISSQRPDLAELQSRNRNLKKKKGVSLGGDGHTMSILDLLQHIVNEPAPELKGKKKNFPVESQEFVRACLIKAPGERRSPQDLLTSPWITQSTITQDDVQQWAKGLDIPE